MTGEVLFEVSIMDMHGSDKKSSSHERARADVHALFSDLDDGNSFSDNAFVSLLESVGGAAIWSSLLQKQIAGMCYERGAFLKGMFYFCFSLKSDPFSRHVDGV